MPSWVFFAIIFSACIAVTFGAVRAHFSNPTHRRNINMVNGKTGLSFAVICHSGGNRTYRETLKRLEDTIGGSGHGVTMIMVTPTTVLDVDRYDAIIAASVCSKGGLHRQVQQLLDRHIQSHTRMAIVVSGRRFTHAAMALQSARKRNSVADYISGIAVGSRESDLILSQKFDALLRTMSDLTPTAARDMRSRKPIAWISWKSRNPLLARRHA